MLLIVSEKPKGLTLDASPISFSAGVQPSDLVTVLTQQLTTLGFVTASESAKNHRLNEVLIKKLMGGDIEKARRLYENHFEFVPEFKLWLATNFFEPRTFLAQLIS